MFTVYIHYNTYNTDENYDSFGTYEEAMDAIDVLLRDDEECAKNGIPIMDCSYGIRKMD